MNDWIAARNGWTLFLVFWAIALTGGLLGEATSRTFFEDHPATSLASNLPWLVGGSLFMALCGTAGALRRRRR